VNAACAAAGSRRKGGSRRHEAHWPRSEALSLKLTQLIAVVHEQKSTGNCFSRCFFLRKQAASQLQESDNFIRINAIFYGWFVSIFFSNPLFHNTAFPRSYAFLLTAGIKWPKKPWAAF